MNKQISIRQWLENYKAKKYEAKDVHTQIEAGWYDWFCSDKSLAGRTKSMAAKLKRLVGSKKFDIDKTYVFFKNNCPMDGKVYDDFRICTLEDSDSPLYTVTPACGHTRNFGVSEVWGQENNFKEALLKGTWQDVEAWFMKDSNILNRNSVLTTLGKCINKGGMTDEFDLGVEYIILKDLGDKVEVENALGKKQVLMKDRFEIRTIWQ